MGLMVSSELYEDEGCNDHIVMRNNADSDVFKLNARKQGSLQILKKSEWRISECTDKLGSD